MMMRRGGQAGGPFLICSGGVLGSFLKIRLF